MIASTDSPPGERLRERRRRRTALEIEEVGLRLFGERGYDAVAVDEIAEESGISRRTFFRYFPTKDDVVLNGVRRHIIDFEAALEELPPGSALDALRLAIQRMVEGYEVDRDAMAKRLSIMIAAPSLLARSMGEQMALLESIGENLAERLGADAKTDLRPAVIANMAIGALQVAFRYWLKGSSDDFPALVQRALDVVDAGARATVDTYYTGA